MSSDSSACSKKAHPAFPHWGKEPGERERDLSELTESVSGFIGIDIKRYAPS